MKGPTSSDKRLKLFENRWLEKLTVVSVGWFVAIWSLVLPATAYAAWGSASFAGAVALLLVGWLIWSLLEYVAHRKLFHWESRNPLIKQFCFVLHGNHHIQPSDKLRNLMPPIVSIPVASVIGVTMHAIFGEWAGWIFVGFLIGYVSYDLTHYACHHWPMRGALGQRLKRHHMRHHFIADHGNFGVTALFWDRVFGTSLDTVRSSATEDAEPVEILEPAE